MKVESLRCFLALAEFMNFSEAAESVYMSQSSFSKNIKALEEGFGIKLFDRTTRSVNLTEAGRELIPYAEEIFRIAHDAEKALSRFQKNRSVRLCLASSPVLHLYGLSELLMAFTRENPDIRLQITEMEAGDVVRALENNSADVGLLRQNTLPQQENYEITPLVHETLNVLCAPEHPLAAQESVELDHVLTCPLVLLQSGVGEYRSGLRRYGYTLSHSSIFALCQNPDSLATILQSNTGAVSLMMNAMAQRVAAQNGLSVLPLQQPLPFPLCMAIKKQRIEIPQRTRFLAFAVNYMQQHPVPPEG